VLLRNLGGVLDLEGIERIDWTPPPADPATSVAALAVGDPNGDGLPDLAVSYSPSPFMGGNSGSALFLNRGGTFPGAPDWRPGRSGLLAFAELDGDGVPDLAVDGWGYLTRGGLPAATPEWIDGCPWPLFGDLDGDGLDEVAHALWERNVLFENDGEGPRRPAVWWSVEDAPTGCLAWGDVDGDGRLELAAANFRGSLIYQPEPVLVYGNRGARPATGPPVIAAVGFHALRSAEGVELVAVALILDPRGPADVVEVELLLDGRSTGILLHDDGAHGDGAAGDGLFLWRSPAPAGVSGRFELSLRVRDAEGFQVEGGSRLVVAESCCG